MGRGRGGLNSHEERVEILNLINEAIDSGASKKKACATVEISMRTIQRWEKDNMYDRRINKNKKSLPPNKLSEVEIDRILVQKINKK